MFVDEITVRVKAGRGGDGRVAFLREKFRPFGGPAGGDGGRGGSVILRASPHVGTLLEISRQPAYAAASGEPGGPKKMSGRSAEDLVVDVPLGTLVFEVPDHPRERADALALAGRAANHSGDAYIDERWNEAADDGDGEVAGDGSDDDAEADADHRHAYGAAAPEDGAVLLCDLTEPGQTFVAAKGGRGGRGNARFASSTNQAPREHEPGEPGQERRLRLELKLLADVGLVGLPSAGKSTLISRVSAARPKIAAYPFTTLSPVPGIVDLGDFRSCVFADLPGLIEGAHQGVGLGTQFLRHIERTRMILHVIDAAPLEGRDPLEAYREIRAELSLYEAGLADKPEIVVLNKLDLPEAEAAVARMRAALPERVVLGISAVTGRGLKELLRAVREHLDRLDRLEQEAARRAAAAAAAPTELVPRPE